MGIKNVTLWDFDKIESHNIPNQMFGCNQIGKNKAKAMQRNISEATGFRYETKSGWQGQPLEGIVFSCVDDMNVRKDILSKMESGLFIETRMGVYHGQVFTINSMESGDVDFWNSFWHSNDTGEEVSACGTSLTIGATAQLLSSIAAWQAIKYLRKEKLSRGITASVNPYLLEVF